MAEMKYTVEIKGLDELIMRLHYSIRESVMLKALSQSAWEMAKWSKDFRFIGKGAGGKIKYGKLANSRRVHPTILTSRTGLLRGSITAMSKKDGKDYIGKYGTNVKYGPTHEYGDSSRNIPARPFLSPAIKKAENVRKVEQIILEVIREGIEKK